MWVVIYCILVFRASGGSVLVDSLLLVAPIVGFVVFVPCFVVHCVHSRFALILNVREREREREREMVTLICLPSVL